MSNVLSFRGGVKIPSEKRTDGRRTEVLPVPEYLKIELGETIAAVCAGDHVLRGQIIGNTDDPDLCPVRSSAEGDVTDIIAGPDGRVTAVIKTGGGNRADESFRPFDKKLSQTSPEEIVSAMRSAGICTAGRDSVPAHVKVRDASGKVRRLIVDCTGSDPMVTVAGHLAVENTAEIINGTKILMRALGVERALIAVSENNAGGINALREKIGESRYIKAAAVKNKYPSGNERCLVRAVLGRDIPARKSVEECGFVCFGAEICVHVFRALASGVPMTEKYITVEGDCVKRPKNLLVPIGTPFSALFAYCDGFRKDPGTIAAGTAVCGSAGCSAGSAVDGKADGVFAFSEKNAGRPALYACIRCGRCASVCPEHLQPFEMARLALAGKNGRVLKAGLEYCTGCGACEYVCPGKLPLTGLFADAAEKDDRIDAVPDNTPAAVPAADETEAGGNITEEEGGNPAVDAGKTADVSGEPESGEESMKPEDDRQ